MVAEISMKSKRGIHPESIPPTADAASQHSYRVYLQVVQWKTLLDTDIDAEKWGWRVRDERLEPIMMLKVSQYSAKFFYAFHAFRSFHSFLTLHKILLC